MNCISFIMIDSKVLVQLKVPVSCNICRVSIYGKKNTHKFLHTINQYAKVCSSMRKVRVQTISSLLIHFQPSMTDGLPSSLSARLWEEYLILLKLEGTVIYEGLLLYPEEFFSLWSKLFFCLQGEKEQYNEFVDAHFF